VKKLEIEEKFLVKFRSWNELFKLLDDLVAIKRIEQVYLKPIKNEPAARIRKTVEGFKNKKTYFDINQKIPAGTATHKEKEERISQEEFEKYLKHKDPKKQTVKKTRLVFKYDNQNFELDVFKDYLQGLLILELELEKKNQKINLPPYLKILKEVTEEDQYSNYNLADKSIREYKNGKFVKA
jgi:hypothetical protein